MLHNFYVVSLYKKIYNKLQNTKTCFHWLNYFFYQFIKIDLKCTIKQHDLISDTLSFMQVDLDILHYKNKFVDFSHSGMIAKNIQKFIENHTDAC